MISVHVAPTCSSFLVNSFVNNNIVSTRRRRQQSQSWLSQLNQIDTDLMIGQNSHETQHGNIVYTVDETTTLNKAKNSIQAISSQMDKHTWEKVW